jgi:two-component system chemotaxis response regulator CheY
VLVLAEREGLADPGRSPKSLVMVAQGPEPLLVVEDDADVRDALEQVLADEGYAVVTARDGEEALELLAEPSRFCLIILDVLMPRIDGYQFLEKARAALGKTPVLLFSAGQLSPELLRHPCVVGVIPKPVDVPLLLEQVQSHCGVHPWGYPTVVAGRR